MDTRHPKTSDTDYLEDQEHQPSEEHDTERLDENTRPGEVLGITDVPTSGQDVDPADKRRRRTRDVRRPHSGAADVMGPAGSAGTDVSSNDQVGTRDLRRGSGTAGVDLGYSPSED
jgi:hypothetical protein